MKQSINYLCTESKLNCLGMVGEGSFGSVFQVEEVSTNNIYALKRSVKKSNYISREIMMLNLFKNQDYIVQMYTAFYTRDSRGNLIQNILLEYKPHNLFQIIQDSKRGRYKINDNLLKFIIRSILKGLLIMHNELVAHRDLKPENILLNEDFEPCIGDLGSAKQLDPSKKHNPHVCTVLYRAPELIWGSDNYTVQVDMWSLGCIIGEMIFQKPIFYCKEPEHIFPAILHRLGGFNEQVKEYYCNQVLKVTPQIVHKIDKIFDKETEFFTWMKNKSGVPLPLVDLIYQMLRFNPNERITAYQALNHPYLNEDLRCIYYNLQSQRENSGQIQWNQARQRQGQNFVKHYSQYQEKQSIYGQKDDLEYRKYLENKQKRKIQDIYKYQQKLVQQNMRGLCQGDQADKRQNQYSEFGDLGQSLATFQIEQVKQQRQQIQNENRQSQLMQYQYKNHQEYVQQQQQNTQNQGPKLIGGGTYIFRNSGSSLKQVQRLNQNHCQERLGGSQQGFGQGCANSNFRQQQISSLYQQGYGQQIQNKELNNFIEQEQQQLTQQQVPQQNQESQGQLRQIFGETIKNTFLYQQGQNEQALGQQLTSSVFGQGQNQQSNLFSSKFIPNIFDRQNQTEIMKMLNNPTLNWQLSQAQENNEEIQCKKKFSLYFGDSMQKSWINQNGQNGQKYGQIQGQQYDQGYK